MRATVRHHMSSGELGQCSGIWTSQSRAAPKSGVRAARGPLCPTTYSAQTIIPTCTRTEERQVEASGSKGEHAHVGNGMAASNEGRSAGEGRAG